MKAKLIRKYSEKIQTLGELKVLKQIIESEDAIFPIYDEVFQCKTLELPWQHNAPLISCIPKGVYLVKKRWSPRHGFHFYIQDVPGRSWILMHAGNFYFDIKGCILVGDEFIDINRDGYLDITNSKNTLKKLYQLMPEYFDLEIK